MQLLIVILKKASLIDSLIKKLAQAGVKGGTILDGTGMAKSLSSMEDLPIFDMLKAIIADEEQDVSKVMLFVLKENQVSAVRKVIKKEIGSFNEPNTGIMFSIPITEVEGLSE